MDGRRQGWGKVQDQDLLLFRIRTEGRRVSVPRIGEAVYELDGSLWRYFSPLERDRAPGSGPWRVEPLDAPPEAHGGAIP